MWRESALCAQVDPALHFPEPGESYAPARRVCRACPVTAECLTWVMEVEAGAGAESRHGMWAGLQPHERWKADHTIDHAARTAYTAAARAHRGTVGPAQVAGLAGDLTRNEMAARLGVSVATVDRALRALRDAA